MACQTIFCGSSRHFKTTVSIGFGLLLCAVLCPFGAIAQTSFTSSDQSADGVSMMPTPGGHDYQHLLSETVSFGNGQLSYRVQYPMPKGRGISMPYWYGYSSAGLYRMFLQMPQNTLTWTTNDLNFNGSSPLATWQVTLNPSQTGIPCGQGITCSTWPCYIATGFTFYDLDGTNHNISGMTGFAPQGTPPQPQTPPQYVGQCATPGSGGAGGGSDGEVTAQFTSPSQTISNLSSTGNIWAFTVTDKNGTTYFFSGGSAPQHLGGVFVQSPSKIEDRNGNIITNTTGYVDTLERTVSTVSGSSQIIGGITYPPATAPAGAPTSVPVSYAVPNSQGTNPCFINSPGINIGQVTGTQPAWSAVPLPDGTQYTLFYGTYNPNDATLENNYGLLNEVVFPGGGWIKYQWSINSSVANEVAQYPSFGSTQNGVTIPCYIGYSTPRLAHRYVSFDGVNVAQQQDFTYTTNWNPSGSTGFFSPQGWTSKVTTVVTTDKVVGKNFQTVYTYVPLDAGESVGTTPIPVEQSVQYFDWGNTTTPIKTVTKTWAGVSVMTCEVTTVAGLSAGHVYQYLSQVDELTDDKEYDYSTATPASICNGTATTPPVRETKISYQTFMSAATPNNPGAGEPGGPFYKPSTVITYDPTTTPITRVAETDYAYDQSPLATVSGVVQRDANYGTSTTARGNVTTHTKVCIGCTNEITTYTYDLTGQPVTKIDPCGNKPCSDMTGANHTTTYSYTDSPSGGNTAGPSNAYLTAVTYPPTGTTVHQETFAYNYTFGYLTTSNDENQQQTVYQYDTQPTGCSIKDTFERLTEIDYPDGGVTTNCYVSTPSPSVTTTTEITSAISKVAVTAFDGMSHVNQSQLMSDPSGADLVDSSYDGEGRVLTKSNPHRAASNPTDGTTTYTYDALGRVTKVLEPDGSAVLTVFDQINASSPNTVCTTVTDEAGNARRSCSDGLGRMTNVFEAPVNLNYQTTYGYNLLDDLTSVTQNGSNSANARLRTFSYNSLSHLVTASNPESGSISYQYDANGNLFTKTAAAPNQASTGTTSVVTTHAYDDLNRLTGTTYTDTFNGPSAPVQYGYDAVALTGCATAPPALSPPPPTDYPIGQRTSMCDGSGATSWSHDQMDRVLEVSRTIGTVQGKFVKYTFNLDGSVASTTTSPLKTIAYTYNGAGRMTAAKDNGDSINFVIGGNYTPPGGLAAMTYGETTTFAGINTNIAYNSRLQPCWIYGTTGTALAITTPCTGTATTGNVLDLKYNYNLGSTDNGNVLGVTNNRNTARSVAFTYDRLNRIASAGTSSTTGSNCWGYQYSIDAWGNLLAQAGWTPTYGSCSEPIMSAVAADTHNRICTACYDPAGNMTSNGGVPYTYDDENRLVVADGVFYYYDGDGNRVAKCNVNNCLTTVGTPGTFYWRGVEGNTLVESNTAGTFQYEYVFFNGERVAQRNLTTNIPNYYFADHLGSASVVTDNNGNIQDESDYYPYGGERVISNAAPQNYKFTGKERDNESGLDMFGARYYGNVIGRFMTADWAAKPIDVPYADFGNPQSLNLYSYVKNNPTTLGDPDGHDWASNIEYLSTAAGGLAGALIGGSLGAGAGTLALPGGGTIGGGYAGGAIGAGLGAGYGAAVGSAIVNTIKAVSSSKESESAPAPANQPGPSAPTSGADKGGSKPGEVYVTEPQESGKEYVGRTTQGVDQRMETRTDGRTGKATAVDSYKSTEEGRYKEQKAIDQRGGVQNLDNKRNEVNQQKMQELKKKYDN
jgi:RHS repeat-associated protein